MNSALAIAQSGGPTPVINASLAGVIQAAAAQAEIGQIYGLVNGLEGALKGEIIDLSGLPAETLARLAETPAAALGSGRYKVVEADYERILNFFWAHQVRYFVHIGGNGSMYITHRLAEVAETRRHALSVIGVPKTIDNDLDGTDHSPGYGSAARFLALATRDTGRDLESMVNFDDVIILETMGRNAGWLAAAAALGKESEAEAPHLVYTPEIVFDEAHFLEEVARLHRRLGRVFVVVAEGIRNRQGDFVGQVYQTDPLGRVVHARGTGVAAYLNGLVQEQLKLQTRFLRPGLIGRASSACVSATDREEAYRAGQAAVEQLVGGQSGLMITLERLSDQPYNCQAGTTPLEAVTGLEKTMPRAYMDEAGTMITEAFRQYALPLIGEPLRPLARLRG